MATANAFTITCAIIACFGTLFGLLLVIRMLHIRVIMKREQSSYYSILYWTTFTAIVFYTAVITLNFISFLIHIVNNTEIQHKSNDLIYLLIDASYGFCYIYSMISMISVFLLRIQVTFGNSFYELSKHTIRKLWILIIITAFLGTGGAICDVIATKLAKILLYLIAGSYISLLFGLSSYLLYIFVSKLKTMHKTYVSFEYEDNLEALELYRIIVRVTLIAVIAIISTFILTIFGTICDMITLFRDDKSLTNDLEFLTRTLFVIDSIIGSLAMFLTMQKNKNVYHVLCKRCEHRFFIQNNENIPAKPSNISIGDVVDTNTGKISNIIVTNTDATKRSIIPLPSPQSTPRSDNASPPSTESTHNTSPRSPRSTENTLHIDLQ